MRLAYALVSVTLCANPEVDRIFAPYAKPGSPGCAVGVLKDGKTVLSKGYGLADLDQNIAISPKTRFYMASVSKQFTSLALLIAEKEGKLRLDDSVRKWVPEMPAYAEGITIRRMLDHTAGLRDYLALWGMRGFSNESVLRLGPTLDLIARQTALNYPAGSDYSYSNSGYLLATVALERATGKTLAQWTREKIHAPLEMHASRFQDDHGEPVPDRAHGYHRRNGFKTVDVGFDLVGSGGMYSNIDDMLKWARNFDEKTVAGGLLEPLYMPGKLADGRPTPGGYALGMINKDGTISHAGGASGYSTFFLRVPAANVTVVCLCNLGGAPVAELAHRTAAVFGAPAGPAAPARPKAEAVMKWNGEEQEKLAGSYWSEELESVWKIHSKNGTLWLRNAGEDIRIEKYKDGYRAGGYTLQLAGDRLEAGAGRARGIVFTRRAAESR
ncbi:MAG: beta-lactamase family protein [Acidobacteria bacterium]|nr:beta-lactamase family protein [Acidobacteriota bacterium]